jgi:tRNA pseudouridine38-40 synthase
MREAARAFVGMKDFTAFAEEDAQRQANVVVVDRLDIVEEGALVLVAIEGSHFLWKMVRRIVGVLVEIGRGGLNADAAALMMRDDSSLPAKLTAPPSGLFLERVYYKNDRRDPSVRAMTPLA